MIRKFIEKRRIVLSRVIMLLYFILFISSRSGWDGTIVRYLLLSLGLFFVAVASLGRMWCSIYIAGYKNGKLVSEGPYSISRNPLYLFSFIGALGIGLSTGTLTMTLLIAALFLLYYPFVIAAEEKKLYRLFAREFTEYKKRVPVFLPNFALFEEPENYNVNPVIYRRHIFSAVWFVWAVGVIVFIDGLKETGVLPSYLLLY